MTTMLDASHKTAIEHWETITRMKECQEEVENHLWKCVVAVFKRCQRTNSGLLSEPQERRKDRYVQFELTSANKSGGAGSHFAFGVEQISAASVLGIGAERVMFYVYTSCDENTAKRLCAVTDPPLGFARANLDWDQGSYVHKMELPPLKWEQFCDPQQLDRNFSVPLTNLVEWYRANKQRLLR